MGTNDLAKDLVARAESSELTIGNHGQLIDGCEDAGTMGDDDDDAVAFTNTLMALARASSPSASRFELGSSSTTRNGSR